MVQWKELTSRRRLKDVSTWLGSTSFPSTRSTWWTTVRSGGWCNRVRMASLGGSAEPHGASAAISTHSSRCKIKRTPVVLNYPRRPDVAHFRVLQWNVLADGLAQHGDFCRAPPACLEWEYRQPLLLQEILEADADIICLQELNHFDELDQVLSGLGYEGAFREKHGSPALKYEYPPDGMAVFYRRNRFRCCANGVEGRSFHDYSTGREQSQGFLQILLYDMVVGRELLIVTTHLKAKDGAECEDLRLQQANQLLRNVESTLQRLQHHPNHHHRHRDQGGLGGAAATNGAGGGGRGSSSGSAGSRDLGNGAGRSRNGAAAATATSGSPHAGNGAAKAEGGSYGHDHNNGNASIAGEGSGGGGEEARSGAGGGRTGSGNGSFCIPVVITGDFNTMPGSKTCEAFRRHPLGLQSLWEQRPLDATLSSSDLDQSGSNWENVLQLPQPLAQAPTAATAASGTAPSTSALPPQLQQQQEAAASPSSSGSGTTSRAVAATASATAPGSSGGGVSASLPSSLASFRPPPSEFSTWKFRVKGESKRISDYIWFSGGGNGGGGGNGANGGGGGGGGPLRPLQRWRMLTEEEIGPGALPSTAYGSDHVSLCCLFEWDVDADLDWVPPSREPDWG